MTTKKTGVDQQLIRDLAGILNDTNLTEIEVELGDLKVRVSRHAPAVHAVAAPQPTYAPAPTAAPAGETPANAVDPGSYQRGPKAKIIIARDEKPGGDRPVFVAVNGKSMLIPRAEPCDVGLPYVEALAHATQTLYDMDEEGNITSREVPLYPMQILSMPAAA